MKRFDDQILRSNDIGDAFQLFVIEALRTEHFHKLVGQRHIRGFLTRGRDGAIDHLAVEKDSSSTNYIVIECKHFGRERSGNPTSDWREVARTLEKSLKEGALAPPKARPVSHRPWFNEKQPITGYWFCTSGIMTPGAEEALRTEIGDFFCRISETSSSLSHLKSVEVDVVSWGQFSDAIESSPPLNFRWFTQFPRGITPLKGGVKTDSFRSFLNDGGLPFYSRSEFNSELKITNVPNERELIEELLSPTGPQALLISGPGGVGKTRLMMQLAKFAQDIEWLVLQIDRRCRQQAIEQIASTYQESARVLLLIDYAEVCEDLSEIVDEVTYVNERGGHEFKIITTCRTSATLNIENTFRELHFEKVSFDHSYGREYSKWVSRKIIIDSGLPEDKIASVVGSGLPVLSAFAVYLFQKHSDIFSEQFTETGANGEFADWSEHRLAISLSSSKLLDGETARKLAEIAAVLPCDKQTYLSIRDRDDFSRRLFDVLIHDRWIESTSEGLCFAHDIFADTLIARYVFENKVTATDRLGDVIFGSLRHADIQTVIGSIDRLASHDKFGEIDGYAVLSRLLSGALYCKVRADKSSILFSKLINSLDAARLIRDSKVFAEDLLKDRESDIAIAKISHDIATNKSRENVEKFMGTLIPILDESVKSERRSNIVLHSALEYNPERYWVYAQKWIQKNPKLAQTRFLYSVCLSNLSELPARRMVEQLIWFVPFLKSWIDKFGESHFARFVFEPWLKLASKVDPVSRKNIIEYLEPKLHAWVKKHNDADYCRFVLQPWLDTLSHLPKGEKDRKVSRLYPYVEQWVNKHGNNEFADFVFRAWLAAGGNATALEKQILNWIDKYKEKEDIDFLIFACVKSNIEYFKVRDAAMFWLSQNTKNEKAEFLLQAIVKDDQLPTSSILDILNWADNFPSNRNAPLRIRSLLSSCRHQLSGDQDPQLQERSILVAVKVLDQLNTKYLSDVWVRGAALAILNTLCFKRKFVPNLKKDISIVHLRLFRNKYTYSIDEFSNLARGALAPVQISHLVELIEAREIDAIQDAVFIDYFIDWLRQWPLGPKYQGPIVRLQQALPNVRVLDRLSNSR